jgi:hypothetical protein
MGCWPNISRVDKTKQGDRLDLYTLLIFFNHIPTKTAIFKKTPLFYPAGIHIA